MSESSVKITLEGMKVLDIPLELCPNGVALQWAYYDDFDGCFINSDLVADCYYAGSHLWQRVLAYLIYNNVHYISDTFLSEIVNKDIGCEVAFYTVVYAELAKLKEIV